MAEETSGRRDFMTVKELAERYRTSVQVIYQWIAERRLPEDAVLRLGRKILIHRANLEELESKGGELVKKAG